MQTFARKDFPLSYSNLNELLRALTYDGSTITKDYIESDSWKESIGKSTHTLHFSDGRKCKFIELHKVTNKGNGVYLAGAPIGYTMPQFF